jgi:fructosamine-3-kinase
MSFGMDSILVSKASLSTTLSEEVVSVDFLMQGQIGDIYKVHTPTKAYILKTSEQPEFLSIEAKMLEDIKKYDILTPHIYEAKPQSLLLEYIHSSPQTQEQKERAAAEALAKLHTVSNDARMYGYYYNTSIASFVQNNEQTHYAWGLFLAQMRLLPMAKKCYDLGAISLAQVQHIEGICRSMYRYFDVTSIYPSLLHGDLWGGNILFNMSGATLLDPALYFGDKEMEIAYIVMRGTFGKTFLDHYTAQHPLSEDFFEHKLPLYQLYPTLVHLALGQKEYVPTLEGLLKKLKL